MAGGINSFNLLNIDSTYKKSGTDITSGKENQLSVKVSDAGAAAIKEVFALGTPATTGTSRLTAALQAIVDLSGTNININGANDEKSVLKAIGDHIMNKQGAQGNGPTEPLTDNERTLLQNLTILLKVARKVDSSSDCFKNVERNNRYTYDEHKTPIDQNRSPANKPQTAWTSWAEDALAFEEVRTDLSGLSKGGDPFKQVGTSLSEVDHVSMLKKFSLAAAQKIDPSATFTIGDEATLKQNLNAQKNEETRSSPASSSVTAPNAPEPNPVSGGGNRLTASIPRGSGNEGSSVPTPESQLTKCVNKKRTASVDDFFAAFNSLEPGEKQGVDLQKVAYDTRSNQLAGHLGQAKDAFEISFKAGGDVNVKKPVTKDRAVTFLRELGKATPGKMHQFKIADGPLANTYIVGEDGEIRASGKGPVNNTDVHLPSMTNATNTSNRPEVIKQGLIGLIQDRDALENSPDFVSKLTMEKSKSKEALVAECFLNTDTQTIVAALTDEPAAAVGVSSPLLGGSSSSSPSSPSYTGSLIKQIATDQDLLTEVLTQLNNVSPNATAKVLTHLFNQGVPGDDYDPMQVSYHQEGFRIKFPEVTGTQKFDSRNVRTQLLFEDIAAMAFNIQKYDATFARSKSSGDIQVSFNTNKQLKKSDSSNFSTMVLTLSKTPSEADKQIKDVLNGNLGSLQDTPAGLQEYASYVDGVHLANEVHSRLMVQDGERFTSDNLFRGNSLADVQTKVKGFIKQQSGDDVDTSTPLVYDNLKDLKEDLAIRHANFEKCDRIMNPAAGPDPATLAAKVGDLASENLLNAPIGIDKQTPLMLALKKDPVDIDMVNEILNAADGNKADFLTATDVDGFTALDLALKLPVIDSGTGGVDQVLAKQKIEILTKMLAGVDSKVIAPFVNEDSFKAVLDLPVNNQDSTVSPELAQQKTAILTALLAGLRPEA